MRTLLAALTALMLLATPVVAGDFEDANAAYIAGYHQKAFRLFKSLAEQGDARAQNNLGWMYANGKGVPEDNAKAVYWYRKAAEQGDARAQNNLGWMYANGKGVPEDNAKAVYWYHKAAEQGDARAQNNLGWMYANGKGVPEDNAKAVYWYRKAAEQGDSWAQKKVVELEKMAATSVAGDEQEAFRLPHVKPLAEQGYAGAQYALGQIYRKGEDVPKDDAKAVHWYRKAAEQGYLYAQYNLGTMYSNGKGVPEDNAKAVYWFLKAAEQGFVDAQSKLGDMYYNGYGLPKHAAKAVYWYRKAAEQGDVDAQRQIKRPRLIFKAIKMLKFSGDYQQIFSLLKPLAKDGNKKALHQLGVMYAKGQGVAQSDIEAYAAWSAAAHRGYQQSQEARDTLASYISEQDLVKAKKLAKEYWVTHILK